MQGARILVAVHEPGLRGSLKAGLQAAGCLVAEAATGTEAMTIFREEPPQLLLLDLEIPAVGSIAILAELCHAEPARRPRVITIASIGAVSTAVESIRLGASDFLTKPVAQEELTSSVCSVLDDCPPRDYLTDGRLGRVRTALLCGDFSRAEAALELPARNSEAGLLTLAGIIHESHGRVRSARDFYLRAVCADERYQPAWDNLNRLSELRRFDERVGEPIAPNKLYFGRASGHLTPS